MTLGHDENDGMFSVVMPSAKPAMRDCITSWQVESASLRRLAQSGHVCHRVRVFEQLIPIGKVRRRRNWLSCYARSAMALPSSDEASVMPAASFTMLLLNACSGGDQKNST